MSAEESTAVADDGSVDYELRHPIKLQNKGGDVVDEIGSLTLKRLRGAAARRVLNAQGKGMGEFAFALICESAGIPPSTFDKLDAGDVMGLVEAASPFLGSAPAAPKS